MMSLGLDLVLPSCPGTPESMWIAVSSMIGAVTKRCWSLLGAFITIRLLVDAIFDVSQGQFTLIPYGGALLHAFFVASFLFSILPGPFKKGWAHSYIHVTCWAITLNIFRILVKAFTAVSLFTEPGSVSTFFSEAIGHTFLSLILFIAIFLTPAWTSKFIGPTVTAPLGASVSLLLCRLGMIAGSRSVPELKNPNYR
jgi:hypothetical protein